MSQRQPRKRAVVPVAMPLASLPAEFNAADASAVQAVASGTANEGQQKRAVKWILESACGLPVWAYRTEPRETDIALGRQFVGQQIMGVLKINISTLNKLEAKVKREEISNG